MSRFNFLGHPTKDQIDDLMEYLDVKYKLIGQQKEALQHELNNLQAVLGKLLKAEAKLASQTNKKPAHFALVSYIKAPVINEDKTYFDTHRYASIETGAVVDSLLRPWVDHVKKDQEDLDYKIRKVKYLIEQRSQQIQILTQLESELRDKDANE